MTRFPLERNTSSEIPVNLASRARIKNLRVERASPILITRLRTCWVTQVPVGWDVTPAKVDSPGIDLDEEEHVQALEGHGVHTQKIRGQEALRLGCG